jgi:hypothetical protein
LRSVTDKAGDQVKQAGIGVVTAAKDAVADHHG